MGARSAVTQITRRGLGAVVHPRRTAGEVVAGGRLVVGAGLELAGRTAGTALRSGIRLLGPREEDAGASAPEFVPEAASPARADESFPAGAPADQPSRAGGPAEEPPRTPSGIEAADEAYNPDTAESDLHQPGTEPLVDPATAKSVRSEAATMRRAADNDRG